MTKLYAKGCAKRVLEACLTHVCPALLLAIFFLAEAATPTQAVALELSGTSEEGPLIALVDTGVAKDSDVEARFSVLPDDGTDACGHGTEMLATIRSENPDARVISIKAFEDEGRASLAMIYAALATAMGQDPDVIALPFAAYAPNGNAVMQAIVNKAVRKGATVIAAAGNYSDEAANYTPAQVESAITVGALDEDGSPMSSSNKGTAVDVWIKAMSTSYATAMYAGRLSAEGWNRVHDGKPDYMQPYSIQFDPNGGIGRMRGLKATEGFELPMCSFEYGGKRFTGWNTRKDGKGCHVPEAQYIEWTEFSYNMYGLGVESSLARYIVDGGITLYAQWGLSETEDEIEFYPQWGTPIIGTYLLQCVANGKYMTRASDSNGANVSVASFMNTSANRTRQQWYATSDYHEMYFYSASARGQSLDIKGAKNANNTNVRLNKWNGGNAQRFFTDPCKEGDSAATYTGRLAIFASKILDSTIGYCMVFDVNTSNNNVRIWNQVESDRYNHTPVGGFARHGSKSKNRQWNTIRARYTVKYNGNGSTSGSMANSTFNIDEDGTLTENAFKKSGYYFNGWNTKADGSGATYKDKATVNNLSVQHGATINLYAQWKPYKVTVKYNANGGKITDSPHKSGNYYYKLKSSIAQRCATKTGKYSNFTASVSAADTYKDLTNIAKTANITKTGYHVESEAKYYYIKKANGSLIYFNADNTASSKTNPVTTKRLNKGTEITADTTVTLYVNWVANTYTVVYDGNGATDGDTPPSTHTYNVASKLNGNEYDRTDYKFIGWNTAADGSGTAYSDKQSVKNLTTANKGTVTLYAQWEPVTTAELYVDNLAEPWRVVVATPRADGTWAVPAELTAEAQREGCTHTDGTPGLEAWFNDEEFKERYEPRALEPGVVRLYARNWATVSYLHAGDVDPGRTYTAPDGTTGDVAVASKTPPQIESPVGTVVSLGEVGNGRLSYDAGGAFPLTVVARAGWYEDEEGTTAPFAVLAIAGDTRVYKIWDTSLYDGYSGRRS